MLDPEIDPLAQTEDSLPEFFDPELPASIGRYRVEKVLGEGSFGRVYLARDEQLDRPVAIKVPHAKLIQGPRDAEAYLSEARMVANLEHPGIVPVLDVGSSDEFPCYVVSRFVQGQDLADRLKKTRFGYSQAAALVATVAEALHYAHNRGIVHRDIKPGNILISADDVPYVVDFGLALKEEDVGTGPRLAGSPAYMSPEQARGESHRVDGRSDLYGLGAVLFELLTGQRTFKAASRSELCQLIATQDVRPPRQIDERIPKELERICLKALARRRTERYTTAHDLADDLRHFLSQQTPASHSEPPATPTPPTTGESSTAVVGDSRTTESDHRPIRVVPKGLRSFDAHDADFFLELLPGPRDREGLPDSLRFWKQRIEETDPDVAFTVGLIYGPSGCGKSSLVKAGLLPHLASHVTAVYVEATANETEPRLINALKKRCPVLSEMTSLPEMTFVARTGRALVPGQKLLIVLDQFEQWLHAQHDPDSSELVAALRQCDGQHVQCIVMVREDFWMAVTRFLRDLEVSQLEGHNVAAVDLFPERHARKTLAAFGRAFGALDGSTESLDRVQQEFIRQAVAGLASDGKVICVRLSLFAEMIKGKSWTPQTLKAVGGAQGLGVTFLEETFSSSSAAPEHRLHQKAARSILKSLLPQAGTDIKGHWKTRAELLAASGYAQRPRDFDDVLRILDAELRLITPTDPEGQQLDDEDTESSVASDGQYYQLTHDYLVPSLRDWLTRKQQETRRGRAELRLAERSAAWNAKPENRHLPSAFEYANIRLFTSKRNWTKPERRLMRKAGQSHGLRWGSGLALVLAVAIGLHQWISAANDRNMVGRIRTAVAAMGTSRGVLVPRDIEKLEDEDFDRNVVVRELQSAYVQAIGADKLGLAYALAHFGEVDVEFLVSQFKLQPASESSNLVTALRASTESVADVLAKYAGQSDADKDWIFKSRLATAALRLGDSSIAAEMLRAFPDGPLPQAWDPIQRTTFISEFDASCEAPEETVATVSGTPDLELRSGMCLALAEIDSPTQATQDAWQETLSHWATTSPDSGTHSAARLVLSRWGLPVPAIEATRLPASDRDWWHTPKGHRMVRIRPGVVTFLEEYRPVEVRTEFWLSDSEVTIGQFEEFMSDKDFPPDMKPQSWGSLIRFVGLRESVQKSHPVQNVSWYHAVMFCNWLSEKEGRKPCYSISADPKYAGEYVVTVQDSGTGYRLPTGAEWEYACRAMTTTQFACGESFSAIVDYGCLEGSSGWQTAAVGSYLPNGWGLFDMHGNVWEWSEEVVGRAQVFRVRDASWEDVASRSRAYWGGSWFDSAGYLRSAMRFANEPSHRHSYLGFRLATVPSSK